MRTSLFAALFFIFFSVAFGQSTRIDSIKSAMGQMDFSTAIKILNTPVKACKPDGITELYLKAEIYLLLGNEKYPTLFDSLSRLNAALYCEILKAKQAVFIGASVADSLVNHALVSYPDEPEFAYCKWLLEMDQGNVSECRKQTAVQSSSSLFSYGPWMAQYFNAWGKYAYQDALHYLDTIQSVAGPLYIEKKRALLELLKGLDMPVPNDEFIELPYASCGPAMGMIISDKNGRKMKMELDTGTDYGFMTIHDSLTGNNLSGIDTLIIAEGIWYNYMDAAADLHFKLTDLNAPIYKNVLIGYFNGRLNAADGCVSPFFFRHHAIHIDPINEKVCLRSEENLARYKELHKDDITVVKYINRNGWIYIPCNVNGKEVLMMVETGSRDVNFNSLSTDYLGLNVYTDYVKWRGKDYPVKKTDCKIQIGDKISYDVKGGLISNFVVGNLRYGAASAGDLGPEFFKHFSFIIDPFKREIIFEEPSKREEEESQQRELP